MHGGCFRLSQVTGSIYLPEGPGTHELNPQRRPGSAVRFWGWRSDTAGSPGDRPLEVQGVHVEPVDMEFGL